MRTLSPALCVVAILSLAPLTPRASAQDEPLVDFRQDETVVIGPQVLAAEVLSFQVPGWGETLSILPADARVSDWAVGACQLRRSSRKPFTLTGEAGELSGPCAAFLGTHEDTEFLVRLSGEDDAYTLIFDLPEVHRAQLELLRREGTAVQQRQYTTNVRVTPHQDLEIGPPAPTYLFDGRWKSICVDGPAVEGSQVLCGDAAQWSRPSGQLAALDLKSPDGEEDAVGIDILTGRLLGAEPRPVLVVARPIDGENTLRTFSMIPEVVPEPVFDPDETREPLEPWCRRESAALSEERLTAAGLEDPQKRKARRWVGRHWSYVACADFTGASPEGVLMFATAEDADPVSDHSQAHLYAARDITVFVRHRQGGHPEVGFSSPTSDLERAGSRAAARPVDGGGQGPDPADRVSQFEFTPLLGEDAASLTVRVTPVAGPSRSLTHRYRVERRQVGAVRLGCAVVYAPADQVHALEAVSDGSGDQVIAVRTGDGSPPGLFDLELVMGYTGFFRPMAGLSSWNRGRPSPRSGIGWYVGLGVISGGQSGFQLLKSIHTGPEFLVGQALGIGVVASARRTWTIDGDHAPGQVVPTDYEIRQAQRFGVTVGVSVVVNLSPAGFGTPARPATPRGEED